MNLSGFQRILAPIKNRIHMLLGKALLSAVYDDKSIQLVKLTSMKSDVLDKVERVQDYGLSTVPPVDESEVLFCALSGNRDHSIALKIDASKYRPKSQSPGTVILYDMFGNQIKLTKDLVEHLCSALNIQVAGEYNLNASSVNLNGSSKAFVTHAELDTALQALLAQLNTHTHITTATVGAGPTLGVLTSPVAPFTLDISAAKTTTVKTGG